MTKENAILQSALMMACARLGVYWRASPVAVREIIREQVTSLPDDEPMTPERRDRLALSLVCEEIAEREPEMTAYIMEKIITREATNLLKGMNE